MTDHINSAAPDFREVTPAMEQDEMERALQADGEKLRQLTGEDHGPIFLRDCPICGGDCAAANPPVYNCPLHDDAPLEHIDCEACGGSGEELTTIEVYEHGCGFPHCDTYSTPCRECSGAGFFIREAASETSGDRSDSRAGD